MGIFFKKVHNILLHIWRWAVLCKKKGGGRIKICETFSGNSLKEDLSIDTTFDPCYFSCDSTFKVNFTLKIITIFPFQHIFYGTFDSEFQEYFYNLSGIISP